jgi:hypothetical protein
MNQTQAGKLMLATTEQSAFIGEIAKLILYIHQEQQAMRDIAEVQARKDFLLLTNTPERVRDILWEEYSNINGENGCLSPESIIVAKP